MFIILLAAVVFFLAMTSLAAGLCLWLAPETGLVALEGLDFWNWFAIVVIASILTWSSTASGRSSS